MFVVVFTSVEKDNNSFPQTPPTPTLVPPGFFEQEAGNAPPDTKPVCPTPNPPLLACKEKEQYERRGSGAGTSASCSEMPPLGVALPTDQTLPIFVAHRHSQRAHRQSDWQCCISRFVKSCSSIELVRYTVTPISFFKQLWIFGTCKQTLLYALICDQPARLSFRSLSTSPEMSIKPFLNQTPCFSCDKYWHCQDGFADLKTCGNGLGFLDTDDTFTLEQVTSSIHPGAGNIQLPENALPTFAHTGPLVRDCGYYNLTAAVGVASICPSLWAATVAQPQWEHFCFR